MLQKETKFTANYQNKIKNFVFMLTSLISIKSRNTRKRWKKCAVQTQNSILCIYIMEGSLLFIHFIVAQTVLGKMDKYTQIVHTALYPLRHPSHPSHTEKLIPMRWRQSINPERCHHDGPGSELFCELHLFFTINL